MGEIKKNAIETLNVIYLHIDELESIPENEKEWDDSYGSTNPIHVRTVLSKIKENLEELCRVILIRQGEEEWIKPGFGLPILLQQLKMKNTISSQVMYKLNFFIASAVGHKDLQGLGSAREGIDELKQYVNENFPD